MTARCAVGAGDSFVAAVAVALAEQRPLSAVLAYGVAAGTTATIARSLRTSLGSMS